VGIPLQGELETAELPSEQAQSAEQALRALPQAKAASPPSHPDAFQYELTYSESGLEPQSVTLDESDVSDDLRPLIDAAMSRGTLG
jgi:hypothetical protein